MLYFWKTKDLIFLHKLKLVLRNFKEFIVQTYKLIKIRTSLVLIYKFVNNHFKAFDQPGHESRVHDRFQHRIPIQQS